MIQIPDIGTKFTDRHNTSHRSGAAMSKFLLTFSIALALCDMQGATLTGNGCRTTTEPNGAILISCTVSHPTPSAPLPSEAPTVPVVFVQVPVTGGAMQ